MEEQYPLEMDLRQDCPCNCNGDVQHPSPWTACPLKASNVASAGLWTSCLSAFDPNQSTQPVLSSAVPVDIFTTSSVQFDCRIMYVVCKTQGLTEKSKNIAQEGQTKHAHYN